MKSCFAAISDKYDRLSYSEKVFVDYIVVSREEAVHSSIATLSAKLGIAQSTIVEATKKLGFDGWKEFKISLAAEHVNPLVSHWPQTTLGSSVKDVVSDIINSNVSCIHEIEQNISQLLFDQVADLLLKAKSIVVYGIGTSNILAQEAHDYFFRLGLPVYTYQNTHHQLLSVSLLDENHLALLISQSGVNKDIIDLAKRIQARKCTTIGISNFLHTPFEKYCDFFLAPLSLPSIKHNNDFTLRLPILCIIEILYHVVASKMGLDYENVLLKTFQIAKNSSV